MSDTAHWQAESLDLDGIQRLAGAMLRHLPARSVIGLVGTLGAGKTTLIQAIARAAGIDSADVTSPTFTLLQTYHGRITIHHLDAYRIADDDEFLELGVEELFDAEAWTLIEWADRVRDVMPPATLWIQMRIVGDGQSRSVDFDCPDRPSAEAVAQIAREMDS
jgi:tRNA threonylcarbamoyladenosine biosynthesis protein TsaE